MKKNVFLRIVAVMVMLAMLTGCAKPAVQESTTASEPTVVKEQVFHYVFSDEPPAIDPGVSIGNVQSTIYAALYEGLVGLDKDGNIVPAVAESWTVSEDGKIYTFKLRDGLKWSDGQPLTAKDFEYSWIRVLKPETASAYSWFVEMFIAGSSEFVKGEVGAEAVGVKATDDSTLVVTLKNPASYFTQALLTGCFLPVRQDIIEADPEKWAFNESTAIGNGPFKFVDYKIGSYLQVEKNLNYWDSANVKLDSVKFSFIKDTNTALAAFESSEVDGIDAVPNAELINLITTDDRVKVYDTLAFRFLRLNTAQKGLDDVKVRKAISMAIDRKAFLEGKGDITSRPATGSVPAGIILDGQEFRKVAGNNGLTDQAQIEAAKALLAEAGYPDGNGLPVFGIHCADTAVKDAEILQEMLSSNLGIKTEIKPVDPKLNFPMMVEGKYDIAFGGWGGDYNHPMTFLELFTSTAYDNCTRWSNEEYDALIESARKEKDEKKVLEMLTKAENIIIEQYAPIVPMSFPSRASMMQSYVKDWYKSVSDTLYLKGAFIQE